MINQALFYARKAEREHYHAIERPIAQLSQLYYNSKVEGHKTRSREDFELYGEPRQIEISANAAATYFKLGDCGFIPGWAIMVDLMNQMKPIASKGTVPEFRALIGGRILMLCPVIHDNYISCDYAIVNTGPAMQECKIKDPDSDREFLIEIEQSTPCLINGDDARFKRVGVQSEVKPNMPKIPVFTN